MSAEETTICSAYENAHSPNFSRHFIMGEERLAGHSAGLFIWRGNSHYST